MSKKVEINYPSFNVEAEQEMHDIQGKRLWYEDNPEMLKHKYFTEKEIFIRGAKAGYKRRMEDEIGEKALKHLDDANKAASKMLEILNKENVDGVKKND